MFLIWGIYFLFQNGLVTAIRRSAALGETGTAILFGGGFLAVILISYLLGSVNWAIVISRVFFHDDVRQHGSGNAGSTNVLRTYGKKAAIATFLGDGMKGVLSIIAACLIFGCPRDRDEGGFLLLVLAVYLAAFVCVLGHVFPCFSHFHGGKGVATSAFCILLLNPAIALVLIVIFVGLVASTRYVSLGSVVAALLYPVLLASFDRAFTRFGVNTIFALLIALLVAWCHRGNIRRIREGTERRIGRGRDGGSHGGA